MHIYHRTLNDDTQQLRLWYPELQLCLWKQRVSCMPSFETCHWQQHIWTETRSLTYNPDQTRELLLCLVGVCAALWDWRYSSGLDYQQAEIPSSLADHNIEYLSIVCMTMQYLVRACNTMGLSVVLCWYKTFSLLLKEEHRMGVCWRKYLDRKMRQ